MPSHSEIGLIRMKLSQMSRQADAEKHSETGRLPCFWQLQHAHQRDFGEQQHGNEIGREVEQPVARWLKQNMPTSVFTDLQFTHRNEGEHGHNGMQGFVFNRGDEPPPTCMSPPCEPQEQCGSERNPKGPPCGPCQGIAQRDERHGCCREANPCGEANRPAEPINRDSNAVSHGAETGVSTRTWTS